MDLMKYILYNPLSGKKDSEKIASAIASEAMENATVIDMTAEEDYGALLDKLGSEDSLYVLGGDGTLNRFVNVIGDRRIAASVYYYPSGSGNDFAKDVNPDANESAFKINEYIEGLPTVTVNGVSSRFINGVGYGLDGYCCAVGDRERAKNKKKINYTAIAIKGVLFGYKRTNATVVVDGVEHSFKKVWIAPTMVGRHYGGGMMPTPDQKRGSGLVSLMLFHNAGKVKILSVLPSIFSGEHIRHTDVVSVFTGRNITVKFDKPTYLQIDGETVFDVTEYTVNA